MKLIEKCPTCAGTGHLAKLDISEEEILKAIKLIRFSENKIVAIKLLRFNYPIGLREAKLLVEHLYTNYLRTGYGE